MAAIEVTDVNLDLEEMIIYFKENRHPEKVSYKDIERIELSEVEVRKWFVKRKAKQMIMQIKGRKNSFLLQEGKLKAPFEATVDFFKNHAEKFYIEFSE